MNAITATTPSAPSREKRFSSSVMLAVVFIVVAALFVVFAVSLGIEGVAVSVGILFVTSSFVLSLPRDESRAKKNRALKARTTAVTRTSAAKSGKFFPAWLGSKGYNTACGNDY